MFKEPSEQDVGSADNKRALDFDALLPASLLNLDGVPPRLFLQPLCLRFRNKNVLLRNTSLWPRNMELPKEARQEASLVKLTIHLPAWG